MTRFSLTARWVLPVDREPMSSGVVSIEDGLVVAIGDRSTATGPVQDLGDVVLLPGLINAHTHLEFSSLPELLGSPGMELVDWIRLAIADRNRADRDESASLTEGLQECLTCGITAVADIAASPQLELTELQPLRIAFQEVIGLSSARLESAFAEVCQRLDRSHVLKTCGPATRGAATNGISPHAPYTVHPQLLERLVDEAVRRNMLVAMHLAESRAELEFLAHGTGPFRTLLEERSMWDPAAIPMGSAPLDYLRSMSRAPRSLVIHGNYLSAREIEFLAGQRDRMVAVYCPRTHAYFQHAEYPLKSMLAAGVQVVLGTDSRASSPDLRLIEEMRLVAQSHGLSPTETVRMTTLSSAEALGWSSLIGSITPGKWANLLAVPCVADDPAESVIHHQGPPTGVWLRGRPIDLTKL